MFKWLSNRIYTAARRGAQDALSSHGKSWEVQQFEASLLELAKALKAWDEGKNARVDTLDKRYQRVVLGVDDLRKRIGELERGVDN